MYRGKVLILNSCLFTKEEKGKKRRTIVREKVVSLVASETI